MNVTRQQYIDLRKMGYSKEEVVKLDQTDKVYETLNKESFNEKGLLRTAGDFLGMEEFGRGIGTTISNLSGTQDKVIQANEQGASIQTTLLKRIKEKESRGEDTTRLRDTLQRLGSDIEQTSSQITEIGTSGLSNREVLGSAAQTGLSIVGLRGGLPSSAGVAAKTGLGKVGAGVVSGAVSGAAFGGAEAVTEGEDVLMGATKGAAFGGAVGGALGGISKFIESLASKSPKSSLGDMSDGLKTVKRSFDKNSRYKVVDGQRKIISDPISTLTEHKLIPQVKDGKIVADQARGQLREMIDQFDDDVVGLIDDSVASGKNTSLMSLKQSVIEQIKSNENLKAKGVVTKTIKQVDDRFDDFLSSYGDDLTTKNVNDIRTAMNKLYNPDELDVSRAIGDAARKFVYQNAPGTQDILAREGKLIAADKFLDVLDGKAVKGGRLGRYFFDLVGAMAGSSTDIPVVGPVAGALGARQVANSMQKQAIDPVLGKAARGILAQIENLPTDQAGNISKTALLNLLGELSNQ